MCGIFFVIYYNSVNCNIEKNFMRIKHRGPDNNKLSIIDNLIFGFHRLSIMDTSNAGMQPFESKNFKVICNGEIYNHKELMKRYLIYIRCF